MSKGTAFWILMLLWLIFGLINYWPGTAVGLIAFAPLGGALVLWILLALLGWQVFGSAVK